MPNCWTELRLAEAVPGINRGHEYPFLSSGKSLENYHFRGPGAPASGRLTSGQTGGSLCALSVSEALLCELLTDKNSSWTGAEAAEAEAVYFATALLAATLPVSIVSESSDL